MSQDDDQTNSKSQEFDFSVFPANTLFHERRLGRDRRGVGAGKPNSARDSNGAPPARPERRARKERRKRIDPTTFEKQYTDDELEFMNAMQRFKEQSGKAFPTHGEVIKVAVALGYRREIKDESYDCRDEL